MRDELLRIAIAAARAGAEIHASRDSFDLHLESKSNLSDLVTRIDRDAEVAMTRIIEAARPNDSIIAEEHTNRRGSSGVTWVLDPLDGTANLVHGYPHHAVAVGVLIDGQRSLGVVLDSSNGRLYAGAPGRGAVCDGTLVVASRRWNLAEALVGTGFLPSPTVRVQQAEILKTVLPRVRDIRRTGSPALDLCSVACGRLDAYYEFGLGRWDVAAGAAIAEASGALVLELESGALPAPLVVAGSRALVDPLAELLKTALAGLHSGI